MPITRLPTPVYLAVGWIVSNSPGSRANNIYSPGSDKLTELQVYMSTSCQPGRRVTRAFSGVDKFFLFSDLAVKVSRKVITRS